jgi:hypothetical protein
MAKQHQVTRGEAVEMVTGEPVPENTLPISVERPRRSTRRTGHHSVFVHVTDEAWAKIRAYIDDKCLDEGKFLTRKMGDLADSL